MPITGRAFEAVMRFVIHPAIILLLAALMCSGGCGHDAEKEESPQKKSFTVKSLAKSDIDGVLDIHVQEIRSYLRELMVKLYKRNPRELEKSGYPDPEKNIARVFDEQHNWKFEELQNKKSTDAIQLAFDQSYEGDRVFAFSVGLTSMIMAAYGNKTEFYMLDKVEPQKLYNSARNVEIAVWKLEHDVDIGGQLFLYTNSLPGEEVNLSYERLFGKIIATQDNIAVIIADSTNRVIKKVIQQAAMAAFLPI
ncbi:MAG: hypothetical protein ACRESK_08145 [Gammaproteobacteria bacterium]